MEIVRNAFRRGFHRRLNAVVAVWAGAVTVVGGLCSVVVWLVDHVHDHSSTKGDKLSSQQPIQVTVPVKVVEIPVFAPPAPSSQAPLKAGDGATSSESNRAGKRSIRGASYNDLRGDGRSQKTSKSTLIQGTGDDLPYQPPVHHIEAIPSDH